MEKYRRFADPGTGINPFIPAHLYLPNSEPVLLKNLRFIIYTPLAVVRIVMLSLVLILIAAADILYMIPLISSFLVRPFLRPVFCWITALCCGVVCGFSSHVEDFRRLKMRRPVGDGKDESDVIVSDFHGFVDILVHAVVTRPSAFVFKTKEGNFMVCHGVIHALSVSLGHVASSNSTSYPRNSLMFICPIPTNGLGVLKCDPFPTSNVSLTVINYISKGTFGVHHIVSSWQSHLFNMMTRNWYMVAQIRVTPGCVHEDIHLAVLAKLYHPNSCVVTEIDGWTVYPEFKQYWSETQKNYM